MIINRELIEIIKTLGELGNSVIVCGDEKLIYTSSKDEKLFHEVWKNDTIDFSNIIKIQSGSLYIDDVSEFINAFDMLSNSENDISMLVSDEGYVLCSDGKSIPVSVFSVPKEASVTRLRARETDEFREFYDPKSFTEGLLLYKSNTKCNAIILKSLQHVEKLVSRDTKYIRLSKSLRAYPKRDLFQTMRPQAKCNMAS
ncbi:hypothetical protein C1N51_27225 (plasmid) [Vibrio campbellii]|nr:hypothetical protein C1N51_27225 [Vibrio campbellii]